MKRSRHSTILTAQVYVSAHLPASTRVLAAVIADQGAGLLALGCSAHSQYVECRWQWPRTAHSTTKTLHGTLLITAGQLHLTALFTKRFATGA